MLNPLNKKSASEFPIQSKKKETTKKLLEFIVLIFIGLMFSNKANAQIIYKDVMPDSVFSAGGDTVSMDLNKDGNIDFILSITSKSATSFGCSGTRTNKYLKVTPASINNAVLNSSNLPSAFNVTTIIDSSSQLWKNTASQTMAADTFRCTSSPRGMTRTWINTGSGNFRNTTDKYLAVRFYAGTQLYYGWIQLSVTSNVTVTLKDYAYQSSGKLILAGQIGETYFGTSAPKASVLCAGDSFNVGYTLLGNFDPENVMTLEFSDSIGNFSNGTIFGTKKGNTSGTIRGVIPVSFSGTGYRFRVFSSNPSQILANNGTNLTINKGLPAGLITPSDKKQVLCGGGALALSAPLGNGNSYQWKKDGLNLTGAASIARIYSANTSGLFSCAISNGCGTVPSNSVNLAIGPLIPNVYIIPTGTSIINSGDSVVLSPNIINPTLIHRWYRNSIVLNPLASASTYTTKLSGTYTLKIEDSLSGCSLTTAGITIIVNAPSSVSETYFEQSNLKVQPNPFSKNVLISMSLKDNQKFSINIFDLAGRLVNTIAADVIGAGDFEFNWMGDDQNGNAINSGIYVLKLEGKTFSQTKKLILAR